MSEPQDNDTTLALYTLLVALTPFIPLPFVDDIARNIAQRRMVAALARAHGLGLSDAEVRALADEPSGNFLVGLAKNLILAPIRFVLRKLMFLLTGKRVVELASETYHRGFLVDRAFANGWCAPEGPHSAAQLRLAMNDVMKATPVAASPVTEALRVGLQRSQRFVLEAYRALRTRIAGGARAEDAIDDVVREGARQGAAQGILSALTEVPREHLAALEQRLRLRLTGSANDPRIIVGPPVTGDA